MDISLTDRVALVTGASQGIGEGIAHGLAQAGATLVVTDINEQAGQQTAATIVEAGGQATFIKADVASAQDARQVAAAVESAHGRLDVLVNNAGVEVFKGIEESTIEEWDWIHNVNLRGMFQLTKTLLPLLKTGHLKAPENRSSVINIASVHAHATVPFLTAYAATKGGVVAMTRSLALELGPLGINVNSISPGFVNTPMVQAWIDSTPDPKETVERVNGLHAVGRIGTPTDIGHLAVFLCSDKAGYITGADLTIDGGLTAKLQH